MRTLSLLKFLLTLTVFLSFQYLHGQHVIHQKITQNLAQIQNENLYTPLKTTTAPKLKSLITDEVLSRKQFLQIQAPTIQSIKNSKKEYLRILLPIEGEDVELQLYRTNIFTDNFRVELSSNPKENTEIDRGLHYRGIVADDANSLVTISFVGDEIVGGIYYNGQQRSLAKLRNSDDHILFANTDLDHRLDFNCEMRPIEGLQLSSQINKAVEKSSSLLDCVGVHLEVDQSFYQDQNSNIANTTNYVTALFAQVTAMYANESIPVQISFLRIWDTPDPYGIDTELDDLTAQGYGTTNGNIVHLLHAQGGGGVAYLGGLCNNTFNTGVSNIFGFFNNIPTYSWDVMVITHEIGHNLGSSHTHDCVWNGNNTQIDDCGNKYFDEDGDPDTDPEPCYDTNNQIIPSNGGTVMSYCHLFGGVGINLGLGFGQQPGDFIRNYTASQNCGDFCAVVCPAQVTTAYAGSEDICAGLGTYTLPTDFSSVVLDNASAATFTWSTGNYISAGGTAIAGTEVTLTNPTTCAPVTQTLYLNTGCTDNSIQEINAGTLTLTVYPDPTQFAAADLVTFNDSTCDAPIWTLTPDCAAYVTVNQNGGPSFPVATGASGTVDYDVTLAYPVSCCDIPESDILLTGTIGSTTLDSANELQDCQNGTQPSIWQIPFTIPTAQNASTVNTTGLGSITEVCLDITFGNSSAVRLILGSPNCGAYEYEVLWLGAAFTTGSNFGPVNVCFTPGTPNGEFDGTLDGDDNVNGNGSFSTCDVNGNQWVLYVEDYNCYLNGDVGGTINDVSISFNDGVQPAQPGLCDLTASAAYDCVASCATVDLGISFDGFPAQTSWDIQDAGGNVVAFGDGIGQIGNGSTVENTCLSDGCYTLNFYDSVNNGMCPFQSTASSSGTFVTPGTLITPGSVVATLGSVVTPGLCGNYTLTDANGTTLASGGGGFGASQSNTFCLSGGVAPLWQEDNNEAYQRQEQSVRLEVFPTLAKNNLSVYTSHTTKEQINIVDINGQIIQQHQQRTQNMQLDVSNLESGIYFVHLVANDTVLVQKFIKY